MTTKLKIPKIRFKEFSSEWEEKKLGEVSSDFGYGIGASAVEYDGENKYLRITDIDDKSRKFVPSPLTSPDLEIEEKYILKENDIVFARTGASVGKSYLYNKNDGNLIFAGFLIKANIDKADSYFVYTQTLRSNYNKWVKIMSTRSGQPGINAEEYKTFNFFLPSLLEQQKIASFLSLVNDKIEKIKEKKKSLEEYKKGVMQKIFSQEIRFKNENGEEFGEWEEKKLGELFDNIGGTALEEYVDENGKYNFISIGNYTIDGRYIDNNQRINLNEKTKTKLLDKNNLVMVLNDKTSTGDMIGASILINEDNKYIYNQRSERLICKNEINPLFAWFLLNSKDFRKKVVSVSQGGTQIYVNFGEIKKLDINLPTLKEQEKIADFLSGIDEKIEKVSDELGKIEEFKKGLLQGVFV